MSTDEKDEILTELRIGRRWSAWIAGIGLPMLGTACVILVVDHFDQKQLRAEVDVMKPRVEQLWWASPYAASAKSNTP